MENNKIRTATKWSTITEIAAKLVTPISNMILARLLAPEAFGVVATATMIFSFADMFTESGFEKYLVQHEFRDARDREESTTVAFWTNMILSLTLWAFITIFSDPLAALVGSPGLGHVLIIVCMSLPITTFSCIQMALYQRDFDFKTLFYVRMVGVIIPLVVTIPLAFLTHSYWSLIIGTICGDLANAIILTIRSDWKPRFYYSFHLLKEMISFSIWTLIESISIWLTNYIGVFIVGAYLSSYYLGIYKTSMNTVNQIMNLISAATVTVLFSALSREQNNREAFNKIFFTFQRNVGLFIFPMGVGIFVYRDFVTSILLGKQWTEAAGFIGLWSLVNASKIIFSHYCSEAYRAMGRPKVSVFVQTTQLLVLVPAILYGARVGFQTLYVMRCLVSCELILVNLITVKVVLDISPLKMLKNVAYEILAAILMGVGAYYLHRMNQSVVWSFTSILICVVIYFSIIFAIPPMRREYVPWVKYYLGLIRDYRNGNRKK